MGTRGLGGSPPRKRLQRRVRTFAPVRAGDKAQENRGLRAGSSAPRATRFAGTRVAEDGDMSISALRQQATSPSSPAPLAADTGRLYREYHAAVTRWAARLTHSASDAEDVAQEVFLVVERRRDDLAGVHNRASWLYRITANIVRHRWRDQRRHGVAGPESLAELADQTPSPLDDLERRRELELFDRAFESLDEKQRNLLWMWDVRRLETAHISAITGVKAETLRVRRFRARLQMARRLREMEGDTCAGVATKAANDLRTPINASNNLQKGNRVPKEHRT